MRITGFIYNIDVENKIIGIKYYKQIKYFYFKNSQMNIFKKYLYIGNLIDFEYDEESIVEKNKKSANVILYVNKIQSLNKYNNIVYYDKKSLNESLSNFINAFGNIMVLDLEMTMPGYQHKGKTFQAEIIQAGFIIVGANGCELFRYSNYIVPTVSRQISKRVEKFLNITSLEFESKAISYDKFYEDFNEIIDNYHPVILVYGRNDIKVLNESYSINGKTSLKDKTRFVNLCQIIKNFYDLKNDPGLFKLYKVYSKEEDIQVHDAFNDSEVTLAVFNYFKKDVLGITNRIGDVRRSLE